MFPPPSALGRDEALFRYTFALVGRSCQATGAHDFRDLWTLTLGEGSAWMVMNGRPFHSQAFSTSRLLLLARRLLVRKQELHLAQLPANLVPAHVNKYLP